jgi:hypothetical protein
MGWEFRYLAHYIIRITEVHAFSNKLMTRIVPIALKLAYRYWKPFNRVHVYLV